MPVLVSNGASLSVCYSASSKYKLLWKCVSVSCHLAKTSALVSRTSWNNSGLRLATGPGRAVMAAAQLDDTASDRKGTGLLITNCVMRVTPCGRGGGQDDPVPYRPVWIGSSTALRKRRAGACRGADGHALNSPLGGWRWWRERAADSRACWDRVDRACLRKQVTPKLPGTGRDCR